jgi:hypothetical protein
VKDRDKTQRITGVILIMWYESTGFITASIVDWLFYRLFLFKKFSDRIVLPRNSRGSSDLPDFGCCRWHRSIHILGSPFLYCFWRSISRRSSDSHLVDRARESRPLLPDPIGRKKNSARCALDDGGRLSSSVGSALGDLAWSIAAPDHRHSLSRGVQSSPLHFFCFFDWRWLEHHVVIRFI